MSLHFDRVKITTAGAAGSATGTATTQPIYGALVAVHINYHASVPITTTTVGIESGGFGRTVINIAAGLTDVTVYPVVQSTTVAGVPIAAEYQRYLITGQALVFTVASSNALTDAAVISLIWETSPA